MSMKILIPCVAFAAAMLAGCGDSKPPPKVSKADLDSLAVEDPSQPRSQEVATSVPSSPAPAPVYLPPPGWVTFGPIPPSHDPVYNSELQKLRDTRRQQAALTGNSTDAVDPPPPVDPQSQQ